jgi:hypothetical protein
MQGKQNRSFFFIYASLTNLTKHGYIAYMSLFIPNPKHSFAIIFVFIKRNMHICL